MLLATLRAESDIQAPYVWQCHIAVPGDVTYQIMLWDADTEVNEEPGFGLNQAPRQSAPKTGPAEKGPVRLVNDSFSYSRVSQVI